MASRFTPKLIVVDPEEFTLTLHRMRPIRRRYVREKQYHVAVGTPQYPTPKGVYFIEWKAKNPAWRMPNSDWVNPEDRGRIIAGGDPANPLKAWFLSLGGTEGIGIHGTDHLGSIGTAASHGCLRMYPEEVTDLAKRVGVGTPVVVF